MTDRSSTLSVGARRSPLLALLTFAAVLATITTAFLAFQSGSDNNEPSDDIEVAGSQPSPTRTASIPLGSSSTAAIRSEDLDGDGDLDIAVSYNPDGTVGAVVTLSESSSVWPPIIGSCFAVAVAGLLQMYQRGLDKKLRDEMDDLRERLRKPE